MRGFQSKTWNFGAKPGNNGQREQTKNVVLLMNYPGYTYRLVENQREDTKIRQKTVLNLGANRDVPQSDW